MTRGQKFERKAKTKHGLCSPMSVSAGYDLNSKTDILKRHDKCPSVKCNCQKQSVFTPKQFQLECSG